MPTDWQRLYNYKHNLRQKYRVKMIGATYDPKQRALISQDKTAKIQILDNNQISYSTQK